MEKIINGLRYSTGRAKHLACVTFCGPDDGWREKLYRTEKGRFFLFIEKYNQNTISPRSEGEAREWAYNNNLTWDGICQPQESTYSGVEDA